MNGAGQLLLAFALFALGLKLSAFFSGAETGFYRVSFIRLNIDARRGDRAACRVLRFARNPATFLSTTLIGNNLANYVTTLGVGLAAACFVAERLPWVELVSTLLVTPVVFVFGELMPKNLYCRAPNRFLRKNSLLFEVFYYLFMPLAFPLILLVDLLQGWGAARQGDVEFVFGRKRLVDVLSAGQEQGVLTEVQRHLGYGALYMAREPVVESMTPSTRVLGVSEDVSREQILEFARRYAVSSVIVRKSTDPNGWYGYVRVFDAAVSQKPVKELIRPMPRFGPKASKLDVLIRLRETGSQHGVICSDGEVLGVVNERGLIEQLLRGSSRSLVRGSR